MNIPDIIYNIAKILSICSLVIEIGAAVASIFLIGEDRLRHVEALDNVFSSGIRVRNASACFLTLLFLIANKQTRVKGLSTLVSISNVCRSYAMGSVVVLFAGLIVSVSIAVRRIRMEAAVNYGKKIWYSGLIASIWSYTLAFFLYIP